jgi:hypothetical protein
MSGGSCAYPQLGFEFDGHDLCQSHVVTTAVLTTGTGRLHFFPIFKIKKEVMRGYKNPRNDCELAM